MSIEERMKTQGLTLPVVNSPIANYVPCVLHGKLLLVSGQLPLDENGLRYSGQVGGDVSLEEGIEAARLCVLNALAQVRVSIGDLDRIQRVLRVGGFVNAAAGFVDHPKVINGASDLLVGLFEDRGRHARAAVGCSSLPLNAAVEVEMTLAVE